MKRILFVCHGNICRSPMAEFMMKNLTARKGLGSRFHIESAAVSTEEIGNPLYPPARRCLSLHGVPFDLERGARQVTPADYGRFDHIVCMDSSNLRLISRIIPSDPEGKIVLGLSLAGLQRDVADPWYTGDFEATYRDLQKICEALL